MFKSWNLEAGWKVKGQFLSIFCKFKLSASFEGEFSKKINLKRASLVVVAISEAFWQSAIAGRIDIQIFSITSDTSASVAMTQCRPLRLSLPATWGNTTGFFFFRNVNAEAILLTKKIKKTFKVIHQYLIESYSTWHRSFWL